MPSFVKVQPWLNSRVLVDEPRRRRSMSSVCCSFLVVVRYFVGESMCSVVSSHQRVEV